jgi:glycosyltransferase involved in cell wall biosynthesis
MTRKLNFVPAILAFDSYSGLPASMVSSITNTPMIVQTHGLYTRFIGFFTRNLIINRILLAIEKKVITNATLVLNVNEETIEHFNMFYVFQPMKYRLVPSPIDTMVFRPSQKLRDCIRKELEIKNTTYVVGFVGRLSPEKNAELLLYAYAEGLKTSLIPDDTLILMVGDGPLRDQLTELSSKLSIRDKVIFTGFRHDVHRIMNALDTLVLPSQAEGLPCVILEAMSCGVPIVCSDLPCHTDFLRAAKCGFTFEVGNVQELATFLSNLSNDSALRKELGSNGRYYIEHNHATNQVAEDYVKALTDSIKIKYEHKLHQL